VLVSAPRTIRKVPTCGAPVHRPPTSSRVARVEVGFDNADQAEVAVGSKRTRRGRLVIYFDSSERLNDLMVRARSLLAIKAATGFINRMRPKR
jgi:hypothetical protein